MPAVTPAERHDSERYGSSKRHPPPRLAAWHAGLRAPLQAAALKWSKPPGLPCRRSRRQSDTIPICTGVPTPTTAKTGGVVRTPPRSTSTRRPQVEQAARLAMPALLVEQAARLAMPAVTPAEEHNPGLYGSSKRQPPPRLAAWHARLRAPPEAAAAKWSQPPGLPCRRSRRQSHTISNATGVPTPSGPHDCALHLKPPPLVEQAARLASPAVLPVVGL